MPQLCPDGTGNFAENRAISEPAGKKPHRQFKCYTLYTMAMMSIELDQPRAPGRAGSLRWLSGIAGGLLIGALLSGTMTAWHSETRIMDGLLQRVVVFTVNTPSAKEGLFELPADLLPYRIVKNIDLSHQEAICPAADHFWRLWLLFSIGGVILMSSFAWGASVCKSLAAGILCAALTIGVMFLFIPLSRPAAHGLEFLAIAFALTGACGEAIYPLGARKKPSRMLGPQ